MRRAVSAPLLLLVLAATACRATGPAAGHATTPEIELLAAWMTGSFSSAAQAAADPENYRDIRLEMARIWRDRTDGPWLYVEQAAAESLDRPYRQRVYQLVARPDGAFESRVYTLPGDPRRFAGAGRDPAVLAGLSPEQLELRAGCTMILRRRADGAFAGGTEGRGCESTLRGAAYATSEAVITAGRLVTWDRGFDAAGVQVWGATAGGYVFERVGAASPAAP